MGQKDLASIIPVERIQRYIYLVRGEKVMLDKDLAVLYGVETKAFNQAVKRNIERFPEDFMFQLTVQEDDRLRSQFVTSNEGRGGRRYRPYAFTEQGVAMLSSVLRSKRAAEVNIAIMRTFVQLRRILADNKMIRDKIERLEKKYDEQFQQVFAILECMIEDNEKPKTRIGYQTEAQGSAMKKKSQARRKRNTTTDYTDLRGKRK
ncbi:ORF6N domain-containing protein [Planctomycetota bacterium]